MTATSPTIRARCQHCGDTFQAQRSSAHFCSEAHRKMYSRKHAPPSEPATDASVIPVAERLGLLHRLMVKFGIAIPSAAGRLGWSPRAKDDATQTLTLDGKVVGHVINKDPFERGSSWHAVHREAPLAPATVVGPSTIHDLGICKGRATVADAKKVTEALSTGDFSGLILHAWEDEDTTDDVVLTMKNLPRLLTEHASRLLVVRKQGRLVLGEPETEEFNTEERLIVRLNKGWALVQGDDAWLLQQRIGSGDTWRQAGSFRSRETLVHALRTLVGDVDAEAMAVVEALP